MPVRPVAAYGCRVKTASLPTTTPWTLAAISAPHIQNGRESSAAWVSRACGMVRYVQRTVAPSG